MHALFKRNDHDAKSSFDRRSILSRNANWSDNEENVRRKEELFQAHAQREAARDEDARATKERRKEERRSESATSERLSPKKYYFQSN